MSGQTMVRFAVALQVGGAFNVISYDQDDNVIASACDLGFDELLAKVVFLTQPQLGKTSIYDLPIAQQIKWGRVPPGHAAVILPKDQAEELSHGLSDFLCWARGYRAGLSDERLEHGPLGVEEVRNLNIKLKSAIEKVKS
jgi:hypothetical protein